jgi:Tn3 transposase DDE domain
VRGGEQTLRELVHEYKTKGPVYRRTVQTTLKASYTGHYRKGMIGLLEVLEFRSTRRGHPLLAALEVIRRHARSGSLTYYPLGEAAPWHKGIDEDWAALVYRTDRHGKQRVVRMAYEVATFRALREMLRCKEIWVVGAARYRNPDEDLPKDFEARRVDYYQELRKPLDPAVFSGMLRAEMTAALEDLNDALPRLDWAEVGERRQGAIGLTPLDAAAEPRNLKRIKDEVSHRWEAVPLNTTRLFRPGPAGPADRFARLAPALHRPIRWDLIEENYDQMVKYATAIKNGTASTEAVLSRFTGAASHPAYQAMLEVGKAQRTLFVARYLFDRDLQRQIEQGLNVVESWNRANAIICYGKSGEISTNHREEVEMTALCLRRLQASLVFVNTLMLQDVLAEPEWSALLTPVDRRGLSPLFWQHVRPYGEVTLDLGSRLTIGTGVRAGVQRGGGPVVTGIS